MKKLFFNLLALLAFTVAAYAQAPSSIVKVLSANTVTNLLSGKYAIDELQFINGNTTNTAVIKIYDWHTSATNVVRAAYTSVQTYATNYSVAYTNAAGLLATNTFTGQFYGEVSNAAVTNEQTRYREYQVPAATTRTLPAEFLVGRGFTVLSDQAGTLEVGYRLRQ